MQECGLDEDARDLDVAVVEAFDQVEEVAAVTVVHAQSEGWGWRGVVDAGV